MPEKSANPASSSANPLADAYLRPVAAHPFGSDDRARPAAELGAWRVEPKNETGVRSNRDMLSSAGCSAARRSDPSGDARGAFLGALCSCAMNAASTAEAIPFVQALARETGEPGWLLADEALAADSPPFLESLIELGMLGPSELVWSGRLNHAGERLCERSSAEEAIHRGSPRCLAALCARVSPQGLLGVATDAKDRPSFEMLLPLSAQADLDQALAKACFFGYRSLRQVGRMTHSEMIQALVSSGARLAAPSFVPRGRHHTLPFGFFKGDCSDKEPVAPSEFVKIDFFDRELAVKEVDDDARVWAPALRLAEPAEPMPAGCSRKGWIEAPAFFSAITCAGALAMWAADGSQPSAEAWETLSSPSLAGWDAQALGEMISPLGLMAMASGEKRLVRDDGEASLRIANAISSSPLLAIECSQGQPLAAARVVIGRWLWGEFSLIAPSMTWISPLREDPFVNALARACADQGFAPLGPAGAQQASERFIGRMRFMNTVPPYAAPNPFSNLPGVKDAFDKSLDHEQAMAATLGAFMPEAQRLLLMAAVESCRSRGYIPDAAERAQFVESIILGLALGPSPDPCRRPRCL